MKKHLKINIAFLVIFLVFTVFINANEISYGGNKLEIRENSGRFRLYSNNNEGKEFSLLSDGDPRTSSFSVYEGNAFYTLGDTFRFKRRFSESDDGGEFTWESRKLFVVQEYSLSYEGELTISINITNTTESPIKTGLKILLDTDFEDEQRFVLSASGERKIVNSELEINDVESLEFLTSGALSDKDKALMVYPSGTIPNRIILGNWDKLDDADYYFRTVEGRDFNNPPYSINDSAVLLLYSPRDVLPGNTLGFSLVLKIIDSVASPELIPSPIKYVEAEEIPVEPVVTVTTGQPETAGTVPEEIPEDEVADIEENIPDEPVEEVSGEPPVEEEISSQKDPDPVPAPEIASDPVVEQEPEALEEPEKLIPLKKDFLDQSLESIGEISDIIELLSNPGMITDSSLAQLEELIENLEKLKADENTQ